MGGNAFEQAERLTTAQLHNLVAYARQRLSTVFEGPIETFYFVKEKETHGDIDLLCGHTIARGGFLKGSEGGALTPDGTPIEAIGEEEARLVGKKVREDQREAEEARVKEAKKVCVQAAAAIGATEWKRFGNELCTKVPCDRLYPDMSPEKHYQIDMVLLAPESVPFCLFTTSYSSSLMILACALLRVSNAFVLHGGHLALRHTAYPGMTPITVTLTTSPGDFCEFFGLNLANWEAGEFQKEEDVWEWMVDVNEDAVLGQAWRHMANRVVGVAPKAHKKKSEAMVRFNAWLKTTKWFRGDQPKVDTVDSSLQNLAISQDQKQGPLLPPAAMIPSAGHSSLDNGAKQQETAGDRPTTPVTLRHTEIRVMSPAHSVITTYTTTATTASDLSAATLDTTITVSSGSSGANPGVADPEKPVPLQKHAVKALEFFNKVNEWAAQANAQKAVAGERLEAAKIKEGNRRKAREALIAAAEKRALEEAAAEAGAGSSGVEAA